MRVFYTVFIVLILLTGCATEEERIEKRAGALHQKILTVDTHSDTPLRFIRREYNLGIRNEKGCIDFPRMKEGGLDAEFFAVFTSQGVRDSAAYEKEYRKSLVIFDSLFKAVNRHPVMAGLAMTADDAYRLKSEGRLAIFIGIENGYPLGLDISKVREYYDLGARYITLCHSANNDICDSSTDPEGAEHKGLSSFGEEVVREMNRLGMIVDVSHISDEAFYDVLKITNTPVIASHSSCRALCESPRNLDDEMLQALKANGGVIQICLLSEYLKQPEPNPVFDAKVKELKEKWGPMNMLTEEQKEMAWSEFSALEEEYVEQAAVTDAVNHIQHVVNVVGIDYVGIGSDFDGGGGIEGCRDASEMRNITKELLKRGFSNDDIEKIWGGNFMRVMRAAERIREQQ